MTVIRSFPEDARFNHPWREYQQRVLDDFDHHFLDNHLHVVAPPGSGKTLLGLEIARRLNTPTLILAPTSAIRDQWISRFCTFFLRVKQAPDWISNNINRPSFFTVSTYQGLHAAFTREENLTDEPEENGLIRLLREVNLETLVLDEAHHLKNAWWKTLDDIKTALKPKVVGLTATPPYDSTALEWQKYSSLNGPVDSEISIPELVKAGDLCPHQDFVILSEPTKTENAEITKRRERVHKTFESLKEDSVLIKAIETHPSWAEPKKHLEWIYTNISNYSASLIFLHWVYGETPKKKREVIGDNSFRVPKFDYFWAERLLHFYLFQNEEHFLVNEQHQIDLINRLKHRGVISRRRITFRQDEKTQKLLSSSVSKLKSIDTVVEFEYSQLGESLRCVILSDYIRKEFYSQAEANRILIDQMGVVPIFETLRRKNEHNYRLGILTGSLVILSNEAVSRLALLCQHSDSIELKIKPFLQDPHYAEVRSTNHHKLVQLVTQLFEAGDIRVLIGTKSLLGEGWDAPSINALVLASFVGSFVLSNQMRGRAIRTQRGNENKTANIWHLACYDQHLFHGGPDYDKIKRRFRTFVGVSYGEENYIENGVGRMHLPDQILSSEELELQNKNTFDEALQRGELQLNWQRAIDLGTRIIKQIKLPFSGPTTYKKTQSLYLAKTIRNAGTTLVTSIGTYAMESAQGFLRQARNIKTVQDMKVFLFVVLGVGSIAFGRATFNALRLYLFYRDISKDIKNIGIALLKTLVDIGRIQTPLSEMKVVAVHDNYGSVKCHLEGASMYEKSIFTTCLSEIVGPVDNPKFVIIRRSKTGLITRKDYHPVPEIIAKKYKHAEKFRHHWTHQVGSCRLVYTRDVDGRRILVKSRVLSLAAQFDHPVEEISTWTS
jgi:superfamily II DNA or RNA helicase